MKYGFIGAGNIATAIMSGMIRNGVAQADDIAIYDVSTPRQTEICESLGVSAFISAEELVKNAETVFFAVKPHQLAQVLGDLRETLAQCKPLVVSIAAGKSIAFIEEQLGIKIAVIRVMPNVNALVGASMTWVCGNAFAEKPHRETVLQCFNAIGATVEIDEKYSSIYTTIGASAPAFAYLFIESLAKGAHKAGLPKAEALQVAAQTVLGSAKMILDSDKHPWELIDQVCSPGGMTIDGVCSLEGNGFQSTVVAAVEATIAKDKQL